MPDPWLQRAHSGAIALNNMGVFLLEHGKLQEGLEALQDAIGVMRQIAGNSKQETATKETFASSTLDSKLRKASLNLVTPCGREGRNLDLSIATGVSATVVCGGFEDELKFLHSPTASLIRIEVFFDECSPSKIDMESSIIIYNLGNAYGHLASNTKNPIHARGLNLGAMKLFELSYSILRDFGDDFLPLIILLIRSRARLATLLGMKREAEIYDSNVSKIQCYVVAKKVFLTQFVRIAAPAA